ncbi:hypothetical protein Scep_006501 [Stephania cephalantha]|uniref:Uncharacterized protein n=1 Tax=Stephania cephalantha TaxID=152367 RepID=A0AAP0PMA3_9MAGN
MLLFFHHKLIGLPFQSISLMETPLISSSKTSHDSGNGGANNSSSPLVFFDISNDSPIVGLTVGTPVSNFKSVSRLGDEDSASESGEKLLRCQVRSLLRRVDEEQERRHPKRALRRPNWDKISVFPVKLLVPCTPTNTPSSGVNNNWINGNEEGAMWSHKSTTIQALQFDGLEN